MTQDRFAAQYIEFGKLEKIRFLLHLLNKLTIAARETYVRGSIQDESRLIGFNEFQHRLSRIALDLIDDRAVRTDAEVIEYLLVGFGELGVLKVLYDAS